ncbi:tRNA-intron lyase [Methanolobus bombayensis]|uniref:tRNA-intron lyase n=1 Tax=Methanolobus bombayensis TaxID=38023 RepID=UPI001AE581CF|nr:tRNA-intron lyase [Methanolobus bombayensis]MBP1909926.1 tRNA-intron endonuclease [Methanolobus bombayensis]
MIGKLVKEKVKSGKQAINELYNTGYYGRPKGDVLELTLVEAAYLLYKNKLEISLDEKTLEFEEFFTEASKRQQFFELKYIVYKDLRERGYYVQPSVTDFRVYPRGGHPGKTQAKMFVYVRSERVPMLLKDLLSQHNAALNVRKQMILAIVDEESDITYYEVKRLDIKGNMDEALSLAQPAPVTMLEDRVLVWDEGTSKLLYENGFYGKPLDNERLQLSLVESAYLLDKGIIEIKDSNNRIIPDISAFSEIAASIDPDFPLKYITYVDLRSRGFIPKTGFKFGTHFRVYNEIQSLKKLPHSSYLIHAISHEHKFLLPVMSRAIRLANSVRKQMLYAVEIAGKIEYVDVGRIKM